MSSRGNGPLAELRELEDRIAARTARLDQLQAASRDSTSMFAGLLGALVAAASCAAAVAQFLVPRGPTNWLVAVGLALAAVGLVVLNAAERAFAARRKRLPFDEAESTHPLPPTRRQSGGDAGVSVLIAASVAALASVAVVGGIAVSVFALLVSCTLILANRARQAWLSRFVGVATLIVAVGASVSIGAWAGTYTHSVIRPDSASRPHSQPLATSRASAEPPSSTPATGTYEQICGASSPWPAAGHGAAVSNLRQAWTSVGAIVAGCPGPVYSANKNGSVLASVGSCEGQIQSLGIADSDHALILLGPAAVAAEALVRGDQILSAPVHVVVAGGDLYVVSTARGIWVLSRRVVATRSSGAPERGESRGPGCATTSTGEYVTLPPQLAGLWIGAMEQTGSWLWPSAGAVRTDAQQFNLRSEGRTADLQASCSLRRAQCTLNLEGDETTYGPRTSRLASPEEILRLAPQAP